MRMKLGFCIIAFFLFSSFIFGQNPPEKVEDKSVEIKQTTKIDEFGDISEKEFASRLEKFAEILRKNDSATGYVIFYNDFNSTPFRKTQYFAHSKIRSYSNYLSEGCFDPSRFVYVNGGLLEKMTTELWLVPNGAESPTPASSLSYASSEKYKLDTLGTKNVNLDKASLYFLKRKRQNRKILNT